MAKKCQKKKEKEMRKYFKCDKEGYIIKRLQKKAIDEEMKDLRGIR